MEGITLSGPGIAAIVGVLLSVALAYVPGFSAWWERSQAKRELLGLAGLVVALALAGLHYAGALDLGLGVGDGASLGWLAVWRVIEAWLAFAGAGQLTYTAGAALARGGGGVPAGGAPVGDA
ncbi:MAG: hypothetical protein BWY25_03221 [Chloroflexi bacterium ADurb.Bin222]|nr:MAG: hypothetical protein BWY25_03221 [Chloroflexi bacterium ADurb.Bin222]